MRASLGIKVEQIVAKIKDDVSGADNESLFKSIIQPIKKVTQFFKSIK
jgi:hypothetical protein